MRRTLIACSLLWTAFLAGSHVPALAADDAERFWPCMQRRVPNLSLGQIWNGPDLPPSAARWSEDPEIPALVSELSARRVPLEEAERKIKDYAGKLDESERQERLLMLVQGLFDRMNNERSQVMAGIERYTRKQADMAAALRRATDEVDSLRNKPGADPADVARRTEELTFETRIFQERAQSLTYVCEVPTLIEQRLYRLAHVIAPLVAAPSNGG